MTTVSPQIIYNETPNPDSSIHSYRWYSSIPGYETYHIHYADGSPNAGSTLSIRVNTTTNVWEDGSPNGPPTSVVDDGVTVTCSGFSQVFLFTKPTVASWIPVSPPPNTNSVSDASVSYVVEDNELRIFIPSDKPSSWDPNLNPSGRNLYYQLRKVSGTNFWTRFYHINGFPTNETIVPTTAGIYQLEKVLTNPLDYLTYNTVEVTQAQLDFYATNNPPDDDPPENDPPPTPVFIRGSGRRGSLNFW